MQLVIMLANNIIIMKLSIDWNDYSDKILIGKHHRWCLNIKWVFDSTNAYYHNGAAGCHDIITWNLDDS